MTDPIKDHKDYQAIVNVVTQSQARLNIISKALFVSSLALAVILGVGVAINPFVAIAFIPFSALVYLSGNYGTMKDRSEKIALSAI